jgi:hypothetical protein
MRPEQIALLACLLAMYFMCQHELESGRRDDYAAIAVHPE